MVYYRKRGDRKFKMSDILKMQNDDLDNIKDYATVVDVVTSSLNIPREVLPTNDEIENALQQLPRLINNLPENVRKEFIAKTIISTTVGLFDGAIIYVWNEVMSNLRIQIDKFGEKMIKNILDEDYTINDLPDKRIIDLAYSLNLIDQQGLFVLQQNRELRNSGSIAHPNDFKLDSIEVISFINRSLKYGFPADENISGLNFKSTMDQINNENLSEENINFLAHDLINTFKLQRNFYIEQFYKIYVSEKTNESVRSNIINVLNYISEHMDDVIKSKLSELHYTYVRTDSESQKVKLSRNFLSRTNLSELLLDGEKNALLRKAIMELQDAHYGYNNFQNEVVFAQNLASLSQQIQPVPDLVMSEFVEIIFRGYIGNGYGVSDRAFPYYSQMISALTPKGITTLFQLIESWNITALTSSQQQSVRTIINKFLNSENLNIQQKNSIEKLAKTFNVK